MATISRRWQQLQRDGSNHNKRWQQSWRDKVTIMGISWCWL
jgi:hypothetical protein